MQYTKSNNMINKLKEMLELTRETQGLEISSSTRTQDLVLVLNLFQAHIELLTFRRKQDLKNQDIYTQGIRNYVTKKANAKRLFMEDTGYTLRETNEILRTFI